MALDRSVNLLILLLQFLPFMVKEVKIYCPVPPIHSLTPRNKAALVTPWASTSGCKSRQASPKGPDLNQLQEKKGVKEG